MSTVLTATNEQGLASTPANPTYSSLQLSTVQNDSKTFDAHIERTDCIYHSNSAYDIIFASLLYLLQFSYLSYLALKASYHYLNNLYASLRYDMNGIHYNIQYDRSQLTNIPKHLTIIISREILSTRTCKDWEDIMYDICITTCWAWEFGIEEISVYDATGVMQSVSVDLYKQQSTLLHEWMKESKRENSAVKFSILSDKDGHKQLEYVTQKMTKTLDSTDRIDVKLVDEYIHDNHSLSDPDLCIVYHGLPHNYISLDEYPPWHIRLTEIINVSSHHQLNYGLFIQCLYKYSKVEQRYGR